MAIEEITKLVEESVTSEVFGVQCHSGCGIIYSRKELTIMKKKKDHGFAHRIDFKEQTPEIQLNEVKPDPLYKKEFLSREDKNTSEYARNTATWD